MKRTSLGQSMISWRVSGLVLLALGIISYGGWGHGIKEVESCRDQLRLALVPIILPSHIF
jgi:hypothetical protein